MLKKRTARYVCTSEGMDIVDSSSRATEGSTAITKLDLRSCVLLAPLRRPWVSLHRQLPLVGAPTRVYRVCVMSSSAGTASFAGGVTSRKLVVRNSAFAHVANEIRMIPLLLLGFLLWRIALSSQKRVAPLLTMESCALSKNPIFQEHGVQEGLSHVLRMYHRCHAWHTGPNELRCDDVHSRR